MKFVMDTQCYIHYNLFTECNWKKLLGADNLTLVIVPTVLSELEDKKFDQKDHIKKRAREISSEFRKIDKGKLLPNSVKVEFMSSSEEIDYNANGLKDYNKDDRIITEILHLIEPTDEEETCFVTADFGLELKARAHGIHVIAPPDDWIRETKDPRDKKIKELEAFIKSAYPDTRLGFITRDGLVEDIKVTVGIQIEYPPDNKYIENEISKIEGKNREKILAIMKKNEIQFLSFMKVSEEKIKEYERDLNNYVNDYNEYLLKLKQIGEELSQIMEIPLILANTGGSPAEDIDVTIQFPFDVKLLDSIPEIPDEPKEPLVPSNGFDLDRYSSNPMSSDLFLNEYPAACCGWDGQETDLRKTAYLHLDD